MGKSFVKGEKKIGVSAVFFLITLTKFFERGIINKITERRLLWLKIVRMIVPVARRIARRENRKVC